LPDIDSIINYYTVKIILEEEENTLGVGVNLGCQATIGGKKPLKAINI